jgi:ergothioneine biosynthesis protein EgtB
MDMVVTRDRRAGADLPGARGPSLLERYHNVRSASLQLATPLSVEDQCVQSMPDASPTKWHLAHTTWFFESMVLLPHVAGYRRYDPHFAHLFNSYYETLGPRHARALRGLLTRPSHEEVLDYRRHVDDQVQTLIRSGAASARVESLVELGLNHEQQHQELMLTDIKHAFYLNPLKPAYQFAPADEAHQATPLHWITHAGGIQEIGHAGHTFAFDNETPRHPVLLAPFQLASRTVSCGEFLEFVRDGGYRRPELWLSDGWAVAQAQGWHAPLYWEPVDGGRFEVFSLHGLRRLDPLEPVCHVSFYEAWAYANWADARLPTEFEWEAAAATWPEPTCGPVWQWTRSSYDPYPGFRPWSGPIGEYNGKFMVGQLVLRGGSFATPPSHFRITYRNFFAPGARWQFSGLRLARDL